MRRSKQLTKNIKGVSSLFISIYVALLTIIIISALFYGLSVSHSSLTSYLVNEQNRMQEKILVKALNATANEVQFILINNTGGITVRIRSIYVDGKFICDPSTFSGDSYIKPQDSKWIALSPFHIHINFTTLDGNWTITTERGIKSSNTGENLLSAGNYQEDSNKLYFGPLLLWFNEFKWSNNNGITWNDGWTIPQNPGNVIWRILVEDIDERPIVINRTSSFALIQNSQQPNKIATWQIDSSHPENLLLTPGRRVYLNFSLNGPNKLDYMYSPIPIASNFLTILGSFVEPDGSLKGFAQTIPFEAVRIINLPPINTITTLNTIPSSPTVRQSITVTGRVVVANSSYPSVPSGSVVVIQYRELGSLDWITILDSRIITGTNGDFSGSFAPPHAGTYEFRATFPGVVKGQQEWAPSSSTPQTITVNKTSSTTTINPSTITLGQSTSATVIITPNWATGTVTFEVSNDSGTSYSSLGTKTLTSGSAVSDLYTPTSPTSATINYRFRATYSGDSDVTGSTSNIATLTVNKATPTITIPTFTPPSPIILGQSVTASVRVTGVLSIPVTGSITFRYSTDGGTTWNILSTQTLSGDLATSGPYTPTMASTQFRIRADYSGDTNYSPISSGLASLTVQTLPDITAPTLIPINPVAFSPITASVTVSGSYGTPTGNVNFEVSTDGGLTYNNFGSTKTISGSGTATSDPYIPPSVGTYLFRASYAGNSIYLPLNGSATAATVNQATSAISVSLPSSSLPVGSPFTLTTTVTPAGATGTVTFSYSTDGGILYSQLGNPKALSSGSAASDPFTPQFAGNNYLFNAAYSGDANVLPSTSTNVPLTVYGPLDHFVINPIANQIAGTPFSITVTAKDALGSTVTNYNGPNTLSDSTGTITPTSTGAFTAGIATVSVRITKSATDVTITTNGGGRSGTSNNFIVDPGALDHFTFASITSPQTAGTPFSITITAVDLYGNIVTTYSGPNTLTTLTGPISPTSTTAFSNGVWTGQITLTRATTGVTVTTASSTKSGITNSFDVIAAIVDHFTISSVGNQITNIPFSLTITAVDAYANIATGYFGSCSITDLSASISPSTTSLFSNGLWTGQVSIANRYSNNIITVTGDGNGGTSNNFNVTGPVDHFNFNPITNQIAGIPFSITITAVDSDNNTITNYAGTNTLSVSTGTINPTTTGSFTNGVRTVSVTLNTAGSGITISTSGANPTRYGTSNPFNLAASSFDHFTIRGFPSSTVAGDLINGITVTAYDVYNNVKTDYTGQVYFTSNDPQATLLYTSGSRYLFGGVDQGVHIFNGFSLKTVGVRTITVTNSVQSATSSPITVNPGSLHHFTFDTITSPKIINVGFQITITALDQYGNIVTAYSSSTSISATTGPGTINPGSVSFSNGQWTGTATINSAGSGVTISATGGGASGTSNSFDVYGPARFSATINPITFRSGINQQYSVTITNLDSGITRLSSATIAIPSGFTVTSVQVTSVPPGKTWTTNIAGGLIALSSTGGSRLDQNQSIIVTFTPTVTPSTGSIYTWTTSALGFTAPSPQPQTTIQYQLTVNSAYGAPTGQGWYNSGATAYAGLSSGTVGGGAGTQYVFANWSTDASGTNYAQSNAIIMNSPKTAIANWQIQYYLTVTSNRDNPSPTSGWFPAGSSITDSVSSPADISGDTRYRCTGYFGTGSVPSSGSSSSVTFTINSPSSITWNWIVQYKLTLSTSPVAVGASQVSVSPTSSDSFYDAGTSVSLIATTPVSIDASSQYRFESWSGDATGSNNPTSITMNSAKSIITNYGTQYLVTFTQSGLGSDATGTIASINGSAKSRTDFPFTIWVDALTGSVNYGYSTTVTSSLTGTQYIKTSSDSSPVTGLIAPTTINGIFQPQYMFTVTSAYDTPNGQGWYNAGSTAYASLTSGTIPESVGTRYIFTSWGTDASGSNYSQSNRIIMNGPKTASANWHTEYSVSFIQSGIDNDFAGTVLTVNGTNYDRSGYSEWLDSGSIVLFTYQTPITVDPGKQYISNGINATSPLSGLSNPMVVLGSYRTQYLQTFSSLGIDADAAGDLVSFSVTGGSYSGATSPVGVTGNAVWVDSGATVSYAFDNYITSSLSGKQYRFDSIVGPATNYVVSNANTMTAFYIIQYRLTVTSDHDSSLPSTGENWFDTGSQVPLSVTAIADESGGVRYNCIGYMGTGSVPNSGTETTLNIILNAPSSITWSWTPQYLVSFTVNPTGAGTTTPNVDLWYDNGATDIPISAVPSSSGYIFSSWNAPATITIANTSSDTTIMTINGPGTVTANFSQVGL